MSNPNDYYVNSDSQKNFWDSLQMDILSSNQSLSREDYISFIERSAMFSMFFRGCPQPELKGYQAMFGIKDYGYLILLELRELNKLPLNHTDIDEFKLHHFIKKVLPNHITAVGPWINSRISVLVSVDSFRSDTEFVNETVSLGQKLATEIHEAFYVSVTVGIGSLQSIHSIYSSFIQALACIYHNGPDAITHFRNINPEEGNLHFDYLETQKYLMEAIRLHKQEAYDFFGIIMENLRSCSDEMKRNKIMELLVLTNYTMKLDSKNEGKYINYSSYTKQFMELQGDQLIDFAYQSFIYLTSYVKSQNSIDYSNHIVQATKDYLEKHYAEDISLEDVAEQVNISPQYFSKLIKKTTGFNFIDWLSMLRVKKAKELLNNSDITVKEVCFMVGYKDPNYFSRIFKKRIGITPSEYVKNSSYSNNKS